MREPVVPETIAQDLGMHLLRFVMMADVLPEGEVLGLAVHRASLAWAEQAFARLAPEVLRR